MKNFNIIVAFLKGTRGIGYKNTLPWNKIKEDILYFKNLTQTTTLPQMVNSVIMGRNTFESIGNKCLKNRLNIVLTSSLNNNSRTFNGLQTPIFVNSLSDALNISNVSDRHINQKFVIGGEKLYRTAIIDDNCKNIYTTEIDSNEEIQCDRFFPEIPRWFKQIDHKSDQSQSNKLTFRQYRNVSDKSSQENAYLECMSDILENGEKIIDRTKIGTRSLFSKNLTFDIKVINPLETDLKKTEYQIPGLTTKKMFFKGVIWELIWFLNGNTDVKFLQDRGVKIWNGHSTREYLDSIGLHDIPTNNIGKGYGFQWIDWNGQGINQIKNIIHQLKTDPASRRIVLSAWNLGQLDKMALAPCHVMYLFKVTNHDQKIKTLNCQVVLRSNDMFLGSPFNIASTAILTILISRCVGMLPGKISLNITDAHIYENHIDQVKEQLTRIPLEFPSMIINKNADTYENICNLTFDDFKIDYHSWDQIKADMAV